MEFDSISPTDDAMCLAHITDDCLVRRVKEFSEDGACTICETGGLEPGGPVVNLEHLARVVESFASRTHNHEGFFIDGDQVGESRTTQEVVTTLLDYSVEPAVLDLVCGLVAGLIREDLDWFEEFDIDHDAGMQFEWEEFEETVKHVSRVLMPVVGDEPSTPPERAHEFLRSLLVFAEDRAGLVRELGVGTELYRARIERDVRDLEKRARTAPAAELGPPPKDKAKAGRMNAHGIPLLYVALDAETACMEVAAHSPYDHAVVGAFVLQQPLRVLDLTRVPPRRSVFDDKYEKGDDRLAFFSEYVEQITRPIILDESHPVDYAPTQLLTEFFRWATKPSLDGIAYPSKASRESGTNVVLFFGHNRWFEQFGADSVATTMTGHERWEERGTDQPLFVIDPKTVKRYQVERDMTVKSRWF